MGKTACSVLKCVAHLTFCQASTQYNVQHSTSTTFHPVLQLHLHLLSLDGQDMLTHDVHAY